MEVPVGLPGEAEAAAPALNPRLFPQTEVVGSSLGSRELFRLLSLTARSTFIPSPHGCSRSEPCQTPRRKLTDGAPLPPSRSVLLAIHHPLPCEASPRCRRASSFHLLCPFRPPANLVLSIFSSSAVRASHRNHQRRKGGGTLRSLPHILPRRPLCGKRRGGVSVFACV